MKGKLVMKLTMPAKMSISENKETEWEKVYHSNCSSMNGALPPKNMSIT